MKKVTVVNNVNGMQFGAQMADPTAWIAEQVEKNSWGLPERWIEEYLEGAETKIENEVTLYKHPAQYTITILELAADYDYLLEQCYANRVAGYGTIGDQLDKIYHDGIDAWKAQIAAVKAQYPKPVQE